jgi:hypothetical protein
MKKFCCEKFRFHYSGDKGMGLNIRIIKLSKEFIQRGQLKIDKSYFITEGYSGDIFECQKKIAIKYCPFCGTNLETMYNSDDYVQEIANP